MDLMLPTWLKLARVGFRPLDWAGVSVPEFSGIIRTGARGGDRLAATLEFTPQATSSTATASERAALISFLNELEGKQNRAYLTNPARRLRGSFPVSELLLNNTFETGVTSWTAQQVVLTTADRLMRLTVAKNTAIGPPGMAQTRTVTQYAPHVIRGFFGVGTRSDWSGGTHVDGVNNYTANPRGMITQMFVPLTTSALVYPIVFDSNETNSQTGDWIECPYSSLSRCALVDNRPNAMTRSDEIDHADWNKTRCSIPSPNTAVAADGTSTADIVVEDTSNNTHIVLPSVHPTRASAAEDLVAWGMFKRTTGTRNIRIAVGSSGSNFGSAIFDLGAGTFSNVAVAGTATDARAFIVSMGQSGWYLCFVVARVAASTQLFSQYDMCSGTSNSYTGDGASAIAFWRLGCAPSSFPVTPRQTVGTAFPTGETQTGSALYLKGLPPSISGLLLKADEGEVITSYGSELKITNSKIDSDAACLGYWRFGPRLRGAAADNAPVIIHEPMMRGVFTGEAVGWDHSPGIVTTASAEFQEAA